MSHIRSETHEILVHLSFRSRRGEAFLRQPCVFCKVEIPAWQVTLISTTLYMCLNSLQGGTCPSLSLQHLQTPFSAGKLAQVCVWYTRTPKAAGSSFKVTKNIPASVIHRVVPTAHIFSFQLLDRFTPCACAVRNIPVKLWCIGNKDMKLAGEQKVMCHVEGMLKCELCSFHTLDTFFRPTIACKGAH
jgi:hypothetical protein